MSYKLLYLVTEEVGLKTKGLSGKLELHKDHASIDGPHQLSLPYGDFEHLRISRQDKVGTLIHVCCAGTSVFLTVPRFSLFGVFAVIKHSLPSPDVQNAFDRRIDDRKITS